MKRFIERVYFPERCPIDAVSFSRECIPLILRLERDQVIGFGRVFRKENEFFAEVDMLSYLPWVPGKTILGAGGPVSFKKNGEISRMDVWSVQYLVKE